MSQLAAKQSDPELLVDAETTVPALMQVIERVHWDGSPDPFMDAVRCTYQTIKSERYGIDTTARFRRHEHSNRHFREAIQAASASAVDPLSILVVGCGKGFVGNDHQFTLELVRQSISSDQIARIECLDLTSADVRSGSIPSYQSDSFDLLVTHSLLHFLPNPNVFFDQLLPSLRATATYVMGHEPNQGFWANPACVRAHERFRDEGRSSRRPNLIKRLARKLRRTKRPKKSNLNADINESLRQRYALKDSLSGREISRIVDVHRHSDADGEFTIGWDGFRLDDLQTRYLPAWNITWSRTYGFVGYGDPAELSPTWRELETKLQSDFPDDGKAFTAIWQTGKTE